MKFLGPSTSNSAASHFAIEMQSLDGLHLNGQDSLIQPLLHDYYQFTMCYAYWKAGTYDDPATFDLFFREIPFNGEFTVFTGLGDCLRFVENFQFLKSDIDFLRTILPETTEPEFFHYLQGLNCKDLTITAIPEGTVVFPKVPLITVEGPLAVCQLLETTFLNLVNYASLVATNAARFRHMAGDKIQLLEFGLRRAQGPNGGLSASKYCYVGGFDATSNVLAGKLFGIPVIGNQAHSFICSFSSAADLKHREIKHNISGEKFDLFELSQKKLDLLFEKIVWGVSRNEISEGELAAFCAYAIAFPTQFLALIDTYDVMRSGVVNFCAVSLALHELGYRSLGCRIDSGDLSYLSKELREKFRKVAEIDSENLSWLAETNIVASNDINEETIISLNEQRHEINSFGVGTHLVTSQTLQVLGFEQNKSRRASVIPSKVENLQLTFWKDGRICQDLPSLAEMKARVNASINSLSPDHLWSLNLTPHKAMDKYFKKLNEKMDAAAAAQLTMDKKLNEKMDAAAAAQLRAADAAAAAQLRARRQWYYNMTCAVVLMYSSMSCGILIGKYFCKMYF